MKRKLLYNISELYTLLQAHEKKGVHLKPVDVGLIKDGVCLFEDTKVSWVGSRKSFEEQFSIKNIHSSFSSDELIDCKQKVVIPSVVDSHTHLVFGGDRSDEYLWRLNGEDYQEIANKGGGILSTVKDTQKASFEELYISAEERLLKILDYGVHLVEIKTGYGLSFEAEEKLLKVIFKLREKYPQHVFATLMSAHAVPGGFHAKSYLEEVCIPLLEKYSSQIDATDIFFEVGYFEEDLTRKYLNKARELGVKIKIHADEFTDLGGAEIACEFNALSADHLLKISDRSIQKLKDQSSTVATLLPGTALFLGKALAPARKMLDEGVCVALASDYNPGSCHWDNVLEISKKSAKLLGMNQAEWLSSITLNASKALGRYDLGYLAPGASEAYTILDSSSLAQYLYQWS